jgi:hypothetical protein
MSPRKSCPVQANDHDLPMPAGRCRRARGLATADLTPTLGASYLSLLQHDCILTVGFRSLRPRVSGNLRSISCRVRMHSRTPVSEVKSPGFSRRFTHSN